MFLQFSVNNFRSIKDTVTFSMNAGSSPDGKHRFQTGDHILLNSAVIYGANASGKSNVLKAIGFMRHLVLNKDNISQLTDPLPYEPYCLNTETEQASSYFEIIFFLNTLKYRYGFEADNTTVYAEWLYSEEQDTETCLFDRDIEKNSQYINKEIFEEGSDLIIPDNHFFLWLCAQNNGGISQKILNWFDKLNFIDGLENEGYFHLALKQMENAATRTEMVKLVKAAGLGIEDILIEEYDVTQDFMSNAPFSDEIKQKILHDGNLSSIELQTSHTKYDANNQPVGSVLFDLDENESQGTKKFFALCAPILNALEHGSILLVDQFDASLHPMLSKCIIELFNNKAVNKHNAQLIIVTHHTYLLSIPDLLERDQIWFTEKDQYGSTELYSLLEFKKNNTSDNLESCYLQGRYGAVPHLGES